MAGKDNLIVPTSEQARKNGRKGGKASAESKRKKKALKDCMLSLLDLPVSDIKAWNKLSKMGIEIDGIDNRTLLTVALFMEATQNGSVQAFKEIRNIIGEDKDIGSENNNSGVVILPDIIGGEGHE